MGKIAYPDDSSLVSPVPGGYNTVETSVEEYMERRRSTRIPFKAPAFVLQDGISISSEIRDISRHGIFINTRCHHSKGEETRVSICVQNGNTTLSMSLPCEVAWVSESGIGCTAPQLEPETMLFISNLIHSQKVAPSEVMRSFYHHLDGLERHIFT